MLLALSTLGWRPTITTCTHNPTSSHAGVITPTHITQRCTAVPRQPQMTTDIYLITTSAVHSLPCRLITNILGGFSRWVHPLGLCGQHTQLPRWLNTLLTLHWVPDTHLTTQPKVHTTLFAPTLLTCDWTWRWINSVQPHATATTGWCTANSTRGTLSSAQCAAVPTARTFHFTEAHRPTELSLHNLLLL